MDQKAIQRQFVSDMYPGPSWKSRVRRMSDEQVYAIYMREKSKFVGEIKEQEVAKVKPNDDIPF